MMAMLRISFFGTTVAADDASDMKARIDDPDAGWKGRDLWVPGGLQEAVVKGGW